MLLKMIRRSLGSCILFVDWLFQPSSIKRSRAEQQQIDLEAKKFTLYEFKTCPFCIKVRRFMKKQKLPIATRDIRNNSMWEKELIDQGGKRRVPCLKIQLDQSNTEWLYESDDIIAYLGKYFGG